MGRWVVGCLVALLFALPFLSLLPAAADDGGPLATATAPADDPGSEERTDADPATLSHTELPRPTGRWSAPRTSASAPSDAVARELEDPPKA